jgi:S-adenosylmethionine:tRNA ribosyltransferase-isomerase
MKNSRLDDYDFDLPKKLIAQNPTKKRTESRLLITKQLKGPNNEFSFQTSEDLFKNISAYIKTNDLLVFNNSKVIQARLNCVKDTGGKVEVFVIKSKHISSKDSSEQRYYFLAMVKPKKKIKKGMRLFLNQEKISITVEDVYTDDSKICLFSANLPTFQLLETFGVTPLPPYINRLPTKKDSERYQTVYANEPGSLAAPTAGLHFDEKLISTLQEKGIDMAFLTLHVGLGTFDPIKTTEISQHQMHTEDFFISKKTLDKIRAAKKNKKRIIAVGTTSLRVLESIDDILLDMTEKVFHNHPNILHSQTNIYIQPGYKFRIVDGLITNFHLPKSTLFILLCALIGREKSLDIYRKAINNNFRFFSYGDSMLVLKDR